MRKKLLIISAVFAFALSAITTQAKMWDDIGKFGRKYKKELAISAGVAGALGAGAYGARRHMRGKQPMDEYAHKMVGNLGQVQSSDEMRLDPQYVSS